jgi:hypothetical protein
LKLPGAGNEDLIVCAPLHTQSSGSKVAYTFAFFLLSFLFLFFFSSLLFILSSFPQGSGSRNSLYCFQCVLCPADQSLLPFVTRPRLRTALSNLYLHERDIEADEDLENNEQACEIAPCLTACLTP